MDWFVVITVALIILGAVLSGQLWLKLKRIMRETREFFDILTDALEDDNVSSAEMAAIIKEAKDIGSASIELAKLFNKG